MWVSSPVSFHIHTPPLPSSEGIMPSSSSRIPTGKPVGLSLWSRFLAPPRIVSPFTPWDERARRVCHFSMGLGRYRARNLLLEHECSVPGDKVSFWTAEPMPPLFGQHKFWHTWLQLTRCLGLFRPDWVCSGIRSRMPFVKPEFGPRIGRWRGRGKPAPDDFADDTCSCETRLFFLIGPDRTTAGRPTRRGSCGPCGRFWFPGTFRSRRRGRP